MEWDNREEKNFSSRFLEEFVKQMQCDDQNSALFATKTARFILSQKGIPPNESFIDAITPVCVRFLDSNKYINKL